MATDTEQREREISQVAEASSRLGEIEGQVKLLARRTEENARNAREDYRALNGKIDRNFKDLSDKIDSTAIVLDGKVDRSVKDLSDKIDQMSADIRADIREMRAEIRRLLFWILGIAGTVGAVMVAGIVVFIIQQLVS